MSRTYRRKTFNNPHRKYESEGEFYAIKSLQEAGNPRPAPRLDRAGKYWSNNQPEWSDYYSAMCFLKYSCGKTTHEAFVKAEAAIFHSDNGYGHRWAERAPGYFERLLFQKPLRMRTKLAILNGLKYDSWDEILFPVHISTAGTWWLWD